MKGNRVHTIPYGTVTAALVEDLPKTGLLFPNLRGEPFNNWSTAHTDFIKACKVKHFTRHDLRRTYSTGMARMAVPQHVTELLLDHRSGTAMSAIAAIYNRYTYEAEMRAAVTRWEECLVSI
jgi:integrase